MIHKFKMNNENIVIDINSNSIYLFDEVAFDLLGDNKLYSKKELLEKYGEKYDKNSILEAYDEINDLIDQGHLYSNSRILEPEISKISNVKALCLHVAHDCNLKCQYCFACEGKYNLGKSLMSTEIGKKAIDFVIKESGTRRNIEIDFFGGEPLLNFATVKEIIQYAKSKEKDYNKNFRFTITTNGLLLNDEIIAYLNEHMSNVVLSIDGRKEINDKMRLKYDNSGSYDQIMPKFKKVAKSRNQDNYYVRGTFTRNNLDFSKDVLHLADNGFKQISIEPVVANKDSGFDLREEDLNEVLSEYEKLALEYVKKHQEGNGFNFFHFMVDLDDGPCILKRSSGCGAGFDYLAITPEGDIYPCHQFVGLDDFKIGTLNNYKLNNNIVEKFKETNVFTKSDCKECWAKFFCSGGCAANAYQFNRDINIPYSIACELQKKRIECAIWIKTQIEL